MFIRRCKILLGYRSLSYFELQSESDSTSRSVFKRYLIKIYLKKLKFQLLTLANRQKMYIYKLIRKQQSKISKFVTWHAVTKGTKIPYVSLFISQFLRYRKFTFSRSCEVKIENFSRVSLKRYLKIYLKKLKFLFLTGEIVENVYKRIRKARLKISVVTLQVQKIHSVSLYLLRFLR